MEIKARCKKCGRQYNSSEFVLDPVYRMMVCPNCVKERRIKEEVHKKAQERREQGLPEQKKDRPAGWDSEDEYLERAQKFKQKYSTTFEKISEDKARCKCFKCGYVFTFNLIKKTPSSCPYCGADVSKMRI